jgi:hypothetical protein
MAAQPKTQQAKALILRTLTKERLLDMVAEGWTQWRIAHHVTELTGQPISQYYVSKLLNSLEEYPAAKKAAAEYHAGKVAESAEQVEQGKLDPASARVSAESRKWLASKLDPQSFGDRTAIDLAVTDVTQMHLTAMREAMRVVSTQGKGKSVEAAT